VTLLFYLRTTCVWARRNGSTSPRTAAQLPAAEETKGNFSAG
jgi:hypothetical protein